ncbi:MAG: hypothetical protein JOZ42_14960 [Acetobacteraceae bacterium]|nr:hypothetical protein [Acetobacteraceae bacterium]
MQLREWLTRSGCSVKGFARTIGVERAMVYRYFGGAVPRAKIIRRIDIVSEGAVTAQDFYENAMRQEAARVACASLPPIAQSAALLNVPVAFAEKRQ